MDPASEAALAAQEEAQQDAAQQVAESTLRDADMWRELMAPKEGLRTGVEALRRTARASVEDWLEARGDA